MSKSQSYYSIKLLTKNHPLLCTQPPPKRSCVDSKPIWHLNPLQTRFIYVAWLFGSYSLLWNMVPIIKGLKREYFQWKETFCSTFAEFQFKWFCQFLNQDKQSCPLSLVYYNLVYRLTKFTRMIKRHYRKNIKITTIEIALDRTKMLSSSWILCGSTLACWHIKHNVCVVVVPD